eukprot:TRINITY_DN9238_c0_g2_i1.p1 TRINITY_DN9238_c0_g2~~TRINITY_DN9238_c0_g2_i1.p1  ORF type:complete len:321 (+),score=35.45 TRINITY_DN9238_c0_g2_i1:82-963(+)
MSSVLVSPLTQRIILFTGGAVGMAASLFILVTYGKYRASGRTRNRMVFFLSLCDFLFAMKFFITACLIGHLEQFSPNHITSTYDDPCFWIGAYANFIATASRSWNMMISIRLLRTFPARSDVKQSGWPYHAFVWTYASLNTAVLIGLKGFGKGHSGCWIADKNYILIFSIAPTMLFLILSFAIMIVMHVRIKRATRDRLTSDALVQKELYFRVQLMKFTLVFVVIWITPIVTEMLHYFGLEYNPLSFMRLVSLSIQSLLNSLVWATSPNFIKFIKAGINSREETTGLLHTSSL